MGDQAKNKIEFEYDIFISYRVKTEKDLAQLLRAQILQAKKSVFLDQFGLRAGEAWEAELVRGLAASKVFVPLLSRPALKKIRNLPEGGEDALLYEFEMAVDQQASRGLQIVPLLVAEVKPDGSFLPFTDFDLALYPDHHSNKCATRTVRETMERLFQLQGIRCIPLPQEREAAVVQLLEVIAGSKPARAQVSKKQEKAVKQMGSKVEVDYTEIDDDYIRDWVLNHFRRVATINDRETDKQGRPWSISFTTAKKAEEFYSEELPHCFSRTRCTWDLNGRPVCDAGR